MRRDQFAGGVLHVSELLGRVRRGEQWMPGSRKRPEMISASTRPACVMLSTSGFGWGKFNLHTYLQVVLLA